MPFNLFGSRGDQLQQPKSVEKFEDIPGVTYEELGKIVAEWSDFSAKFTGRFYESDFTDKRVISELIELVTKNRQFFHPDTKVEAITLNHLMPVMLSRQEYLLQQLRGRNLGLKMPPHKIKSPLEPGMYKKLGMIVPRMGISQNPINIDNLVVFLESHTNRAARLTVYKPGQEPLELIISIDNQQYLPDISSAVVTYELGEALKGCIGVTLDLEIGDYSTIYDPSLLFPES
jgi:hypothetical protein